MFDYDSPVLIVGAGNVNEENFKKVYNGQSVIAVDGGANHLRDFCIEPDLIIGDMDSIEGLENFSGSEIVKIDEQNSTDLEKCLMNVSAPQYLAMGFLGSRFDHNFEVLHVLSKYPNNVIFFSQEDVIFRLPKEFNVNLPVGTRISIYPLKKTVFESSEGLKYPLDGLTMEQGDRIGTSNESIAEKVRIVQSESGSIAILPIDFFNLII